MAICSKVTSEQNNRDLQYILKGCTETESQLSQDIERLGEANAALLETNTLQSKTIENYQLQLNKNAETIRHFDFILAKARENEQIAKKMLEEHQSSSDNRFAHFVDEHLRKSLATLDDCIERAYTALVDKVDSYLAKSNYESIHQELDAYKDRLVQCYENHISMIDNHTELDPIEISSVADAIKKSENVTKLSVQILEEISALRVKFRNVLNVDERRTLQELSECQPYLVKKSTAIESVREQASHDQSIIDRLEARVNDQSQAIDSDLKDAVQQIEKLNERVAELSKPQNWKFALSHELKAGNILIEFFSQQRIILDRSHYIGDKYEVDLYFHTDRNKRVIVPKELNEYSEQLLQVCRTRKPVTFRYDTETGLMVANLVLSLRPKKEPDRHAIYKEGLVPASGFCDRIYKALDSKQQGKPTLRVMAATGEGKGIALKNLLAYWVNQPGWEIWLSDPVDGSDEDYWDCPKIAINPQQAGIAYNKFVDLHRARINQSPAFTDKFVLAVFDEFDKQHNDDDKEDAQKIMTAIRHTKQCQILVGQCAEVGKNKWTWDNMNNCALLVLGNSIGTLCKHLAKDMGWSTNRANTVKKEYEKFSDWARKNNDSNPDIPGENQYRIGLLVVSGRYEFLEIPSAHKGIIRTCQALIRESFTVDDKQAVEQTHPKHFSGEYECPECKHSEITLNDFTNAGTPRYRCDKCLYKGVLSKFRKL